MTNLKRLLHKLNIKPNNIEIFYESITHKSFSNEVKSKINYQRLEFLGDSIIDFLVSDYLYKKNPNFAEGKMSIIRANVVNTISLANITKEIKLDKVIRFGNNQNDFKDNSKIFADIFESFVAAIYIDLGLQRAFKFLEEVLFNRMLNLEDKEFKNPKTILQEYLQLESRGSIKYITKQIDSLFISKVYHDNNNFGKGKGKTKKEAEVNAAKHALKLLGKEK